MRRDSSTDRRIEILQQTFEILWNEHGTDSDRDRDLVWRWQPVFAWVLAGLSTYPPSRWTPELMADGFDADQLIDPEP